MSDIEQKSSTAVSAPKPALIAGRSVGAIVPTDFDQMQRMARILCASQMVPKQYKDKFEDTVVAIMYGAEVGLTPIASLQSIAVINGMPGMYGDAMLALVQGSGILEDIEEKLEGEDSDAPVAFCTVKRKDRATPTVRAFSRVDAQKAGLWAKQGPWTQYPKRMLQMRARSFALRDAFPDVLRGVRAREELEDMQILEAGQDGVYTPSSPRPTRAEFQQPEQVTTEVKDETPAAQDEPEVDTWLISPEAFPSLGKFSDEWRRQLEDVCTTVEDVQALIDANTTRLESWAADRTMAPAAGALQADADARIKALKQVA
jgi:hypothetical protein